MIGTMEIVVTISTAMMAIATIAIAVFAWRTWKVYDQICRIMAEAPERDRMPLVEISRGGTQGSLSRRRTGETQRTYTYTLTNRGASLAVGFEARYLWPSQEIDTRFSDEPVDLPPNDARDFLVTLPEGLPPFDEVGALLEVTYEDVFGNRFRIQRTASGTRYRLYESRTDDHAEPNSVR